MLRQSRYITSAALAEAARAGDPELDLEHLLLGLLVTGGPGAALLITAGVALSRLRQAVVEAKQQDLAHLGLQMPIPAKPDGPEPSFRAAQAVPFNGRAMAVMKQISYEGDDRELLLALLDDEGRRVERVLHHLDVDVVALRAVAAHDRAAPRTDQPGAATQAQDTSAPSTHVHDVPVDPKRVWDLISDVTRRPEWDTACLRGETGPDGEERLTYRARGREFMVEQVVNHLVPGREIGWHRYRVGRRFASVILSLRVEPLGATCRVHLHARRGPGIGRPLRYQLLGPLLRPVVVRAERGQLRWYAQNIARAAARSA